MADVDRTVGGDQEVHGYRRLANPERGNEHKGHKEKKDTKDTKEESFSVSSVSCVKVHADIGRTTKGAAGFRQTAPLLSLSLSASHKPRLESEHPARRGTSPAGVPGTAPGSGSARCPCRTPAPDEARCGRPSASSGLARIGPDGGVPPDQLLVVEQVVDVELDPRPQRAEHRDVVADRRVQQPVAGERLGAARRRRRRRRDPGASG